VAGTEDEKWNMQKIFRFACRAGDIATHVGGGCSDSPSTTPHARSLDLDRPAGLEALGRDIWDEQ
jgi:hypothetical protein